MRSIHRPFAFVLLLILVWPGLAQAQPGASLEYKVKAAFIFNFAKYVEWPSQAFASPSSPIVIGVVGEDPFGDILEKTVERRSINNRSVMVRRSTQPDGVKDCHVVFISNSERNRLPEILPSFQSSFALTVSDADRFFQFGGMIRLLIVEDSVRFDIHRDNAEKAGLKIGSRMLSSARSVISTRGNAVK